MKARPPTSPSSPKRLLPYLQLSSCQIFNFKNQVQAETPSTLATYLELGTVADDDQSGASKTAKLLSSGWRSSSETGKTGRRPALVKDVWIPITNMCASTALKCSSRVCSGPQNSRPEHGP